MRVLAKTLGIGLVAAAAAVGSLTGTAAASPAGTTAAASTASTAAASAGTGFGYGTDSWPITLINKAPYQEPVIGSNYSGYIGMFGNWARTEGCSTGNFLAFTGVNAGQANANYARNIGVGTGAYWYMGGPGVDPHWTGASLAAEEAEATKWGQQQAAWALAAINGKGVRYPVLWADIETPGIPPAPDNGWNSVYTSPCSGLVKQSYVPAAVDRAEFNGFANYVTAHSKDKVGVYSSPQVWTSIFGTGTYSEIPNTYEWTYEPETSHLSPAPTGWCLSGTKTCATFFGGQTSASKYALMWQWSGGGGVRNGYGDFDQIDVARMK